MSTPRRRRRDRELLAPNAVTPATMPGAGPETRHALENLAIEPTHEDIARRAYQLYEDRGGGHGSEREDWFQAERELRQRARRADVDHFLQTDGPYAAA